MRMALLTRDEFREAVFARDLLTCVYCDDEAADAHHIIERSLWTAQGEEGGYFIENGVSLCAEHHRFGAETCALQPDVLRRMVQNPLPVVLPSGWDRNKTYDKWGIELKQPTRAVVKYPSTPYLPMSPGSEPNDINLTDVKPFLNQPLVITIKMDGSNTLLTHDRVAARNGVRADHPSFDWIKAQYPYMMKDIPPNMQVFGENMYARHSIHYKGPLALDAQFYVFGAYDIYTQIFEGWDVVEQCSNALGMPTVPVIAEWVEWSDEWALVADLTKMAKKVIKQGHEGIVVRTAYPFPYGNFEGYETRNSNDGRRWRVNAIAKYVRPNHVQTDDHWSHGPIVKNEVRRA
jgi:hypothetical protein